MKTHRLTILIEPEFGELLREVAFMEKITVSEIVRRALEDYKVKIDKRVENNFIKMQKENLKMRTLKPQK